MTIETLEALGFDNSALDEDDGTIQLGCSQCCACSIQRVPCHETGCPNNKPEANDFEEDDNDW